MNMKKQITGLLVGAAIMAVSAVQAQAITTTYDSIRNIYWADYGSTAAIGDTLAGGSSYFLVQVDSNLSGSKLFGFADGADGTIDGIVKVGNYFSKSAIDPVNAAARVFRLDITGYTKPEMGTVTNPTMDASSAITGKIAHDKQSDNNVTITFHDSGFNYAGPFHALVDGNTGVDAQYGLTTIAADYYLSGTGFFDKLGSSSFTTADKAKKPFAVENSANLAGNAIGELNLITYIQQHGLGATTYDFAAGPSVPVPAAAWLLGSGLLGLVGIRRKIK